jgi:Outer membrane protein beta-barrel domain
MPIVNENSGNFENFMKLPFWLLSLAYIIAFTFNANLSFAQIKFGPKAGLNFSELPNNTQYIINQQIYSGYHLGVITEFRLFDNLYLQPGVLISNKGSEYIVGNNTVSNTTGFSNFQFSGFYADIPLNLAYKFDRRTFKLLLIAGPQVGYGLTGKWTATYGTKSNVHFGNDPTDDLKPFDYGINIGGGLEAGRLEISSQYYLGLRMLSPWIPPLKEQKYKVLNISVAYLFGKSKRTYNDYESRYMRKNRHHKRH